MGAVLGEVVLSKEAQFDAKKFAEFSGKGDKKKEEKPKKEQPAKKEPEKKKEKPAAAAEEEDDGMPKEPKSKDPLAALPKGTFDLEVWKGQELAFDLCEDWAIDSGSYDWKKLDPKSEETKALVAQYWKWEGNDLEGRKFNQGK